MAAPLTEFIIETVLRDGLGDLRANPAQIDDIFGRFTEAQFVNQYGQTQIDRIKTYIQENQIKIIQSWAMVPFSLPCISIELLRASEDEDIQQFHNEYEDEDEDKEPAIRINNVIPTTYDTVSGKLSIDSSVDLSTVCPGLYFKDASNNKFKIQSGNSNLSGNKFINIGSGMTPNISAAGKIISWIDFERTERRMIRLREHIRLGCHAKDDIHLVKYIYYIIIYILKSRQESLENRGIHLDREIGEIFDRLDDFRGENVFSRFINMLCITEFNWDQEKVALADCFDLTLKAPMPTPSSSNAEVINKSE